MNDLINNVRQWFHNKGIIEKSNPLKQLEKTQEELTETRDAMVTFGVLSSLDSPIVPPDLLAKAALEVKDGIGDVLVTLIGVCEMVDLSLEECLQQAYDVISKRSGTMIDGKFVKNPETK